jgi:hypothetical protein
MAGIRLLIKILADFLFGYCFLNQLLQRATNQTETRWHPVGARLQRVP